MAREIITRTWCDRHLAHDERVEARSITLAVDTPAMVIDLCDDCVKAVVAPVEELLQQYGRAPDRKTRASNGGSAKSNGNGYTSGGRIDTAVDGVVACPICSTPTRGGRSGLNSHLAQHDTTLSRWETDRGKSIDGKPLPYVCEVCGLAFTHATGRGAHKASAHGNRHATA